MTIKQEQPQAPEEGRRENLSIAQVAASVLASFYGVQSSKNRSRDFKSGKASTFITVGIAMTAIWYLSIYGIVQLVLHLTR